MTANSPNSLTTLPAHGNSIALLDHIENFYFDGRFNPARNRRVRLPHLAGPLMSHRQSRLARLVQLEVLGEPIADAIGSARATSRSNFPQKVLLL